MKFKMEIEFTAEDHITIGQIREMCTGAYVSVHEPENREADIRNVVLRLIDDAGKEIMYYD